jgi:hypothetical protein
MGTLGKEVKRVEGSTRKKRVTDGDRGGGCVHVNSGKRELYLNPNPYRVLMRMCTLCVVNRRED